MTTGQQRTTERQRCRAKIPLILSLSVVLAVLVFNLRTQLQTYTPDLHSTPQVNFQGFTTSNCSSPERYRALQSNHTIKFVTAKFGYADRFRNEVLHRRREAINTFDWLNEENAVGLYSVPDEWRKDFPNHTQFLDNPDHESATGGGWWFWKPVVILEQLKSLEDGDLLFYADNDQTPWWPTITDFLSTMIDHAEYDWALPRWHGGTEFEYTKKDVFVAHCASTEIDQKQLRKSFESSQWEAGIHIIRNSAKTRQFARQWKALSKDYHAISDEPSYLRNHKGFIDHRRDQSLLNMLIKCTFRVGLLYTEIPHSCGWLFRQYMIDFNFLSLPDVTDDYLITWQNKSASKWAVLQEKKEIDGV